MKFNLETARATYRIQSYNDHEIRVGGQCLTQSAIILPETLIVSGLPATSQDLTSEHFQQLRQLQPTPELVLLGTGARIHFPPPALMQILTSAKIGLEVMTTAAACRTYNVLVAEERQVALMVFMIAL